MNILASSDNMGTNGAAYYVHLAVRSDILTNTTTLPYCESVLFITKQRTNYSVII